MELEDEFNKSEKERREKEKIIENELNEKNRKLQLLEEELASIKSQVSSTAVCCIFSIH